jgi:hypothetical protein
VENFGNKRPERHKLNKFSTGFPQGQEGRGWFSTGGCGKLCGKGVERKRRENSPQVFHRVFHRFSTGQRGEVGDTLGAEKVFHSFHRA